MARAEPGETMKLGRQDWAIEHVEGDEYFVISLLDHDATDVEMLGSDVTGTRCGLGFSCAGT